MPDSSILITAKDNYTSAVSKMSQTTKSFSKNADDMQRILTNLTNQKHDLKLDAQKARDELKALEKQYLATGDAQDKLAMDSSAQKYDDIRRNLSLVTKGASEAERQMQRTGDAFRKTGNQSVGFSSIVSAVASAGALKMLGDVALNATNTFIGSAAGNETGTMISSVLSSAISGAAIGSIIPGIGTAVGAAIGAGTGLLSGATANFETKDTAFKSYVQDAYNTVTGEQSTSLSAGSATAASRETTQLSFSTLFGSKEKASAYLSSLTDFAAKTPYAYDDLTSISKTLKTFGYAVEDMIPTLTKVGDAGAALGLSTSDISTVATYIGRMKSSDKATLEYLNPLNERGFSVFQWIADDLNTSIAKVYEKISKGELSGSYVSDLILNQFQNLYGGMMDIQSKTFEGLSSTLSDVQTELDNAMGKGYNDERKKGITSEIDFLSGENGQKMQEAYSAIGAWKADLENEKEKYIRDALDAAMKSDEYVTAQQEGDAAEMGRILMAAKVQGMNDYNASPDAKLAVQSDIDLAKSIQEDTASDDAYWNAGYQKGQQFSKGLAFGMMNGFDSSASMPADGGYTYTDPYGRTNYASNAYGLTRVPYNNFPALLHEDEQVLTASEARSYKNGGGVNVTVTGNNFTVRDDGDAERIADLVGQKVYRAFLLAAPAS
ncbi:hypothetical protein SDC9_57902 [bioreactor metagenome]|uniref:Tape measure protein N-terminal domain-containing protein n=1 Tax=bioreactor metagenome TaxID=1076179 RepID=A0A644X5W9_9ZZZZ